METLAALGYDGPLTLELEEPDVEGALRQSKDLLSALLP